MNRTWQMMASCGVVIALILLAGVVLVVTFGRDLDARRDFGTDTACAILVACWSTRR